MGIPTLRESGNKTVYKKQVVGTVTQFPNRIDAAKAAARNSGWTLTMGPNTLP